MDRLRPGRNAIAALGLALLCAGGLSAVVLGAASAGAPNPSQPPQQWAYGAEHWANVSANGSFGQYQVSAFFGWTLVYTLTNTSNSTFTLEAQRTMALRYSASLCAPSCANPTHRAAVAIDGLETDTAFDNLTTGAYVFENGSAVGAIGLENAQSSGAASLRESLNGTRPINGVLESGSAQFSLNATADAQVSFATPLGLVPWAPSAGARWNASAAYTASGAYAVQFAWSVRTATGSINASGSGSPSGQVNASGTVQLAGADLGNLTLANGASATVIVLGWSTGAFTAEDGIVLLPTGFAVFGGGATPWAPHLLGAQSVLGQRLDLSIDALHHRFRATAAASSYAGTDAVAPAGGPGAGAVTPAATASDPGNPTLVQAQPMSVPSAQSTAACLATGCVGAGGGSAPALRPLTELLVVGLVVAAVLGTVGVVEYRMWSRRRSRAELMGGYASQLPPATSDGPAEAGRIPPPPPSA